MAQRRPMGSLEADILEILWRSDGPVTPAEVRDRVGGELAYTTIATILTRLVDKGLVRRTRRGRGYTYAATVSEAELTAARMRSALAASTDRIETMSRFVDGLSAKEAAALRAALEGLDG
jgi:predicted transcriptional regulator